ncbi:aldo/keto reductase [Frankia sp. R82]|uniref:aldo/keto reductase n=1 Tax=Frankia sp. R82 TaxID=2950553 RepID=UPI002043A644|nr:aldo/keto reductase [Frankia sp. R82]MCM3885273.1 aldo/keto reductase [Frankia sp. R82]
MDQANDAAPTRLSAESLSEKDRAVAKAVHEVAGELGVTSSQVAIAWTTHRSATIRPILGVRRVDQLRDNLGALDVTLPPELVSRLDDATGFSPGFPTEFIDQTSPWVFGAALVEPSASGQR